MREHRFALDIGRRWRLDFAWPVHMVAVEIEGGTAIGGRHTRVIGFREDSHKADAATCLGWRVLRGDAQMLRKGFLLAYLEDALAGCPPRVSGGPKNYRVAR